MKLVVVPILMLLLAVQCFSKWLIVLDYQVNQDYIAQNLCDNRTKPELHCKGKCQLTKKLAADEQQTNTPSGPAKIKFVEVLFDHSAPLFSFSSGKLFVSPNQHYLIKKYSAPAPAIFHPPATA